MAFRIVILRAQISQSSKLVVHSMTRIHKFKCNNLLGPRALPGRNRRRRRHYCSMPFKSAINVQYFKCQKILLTFYTAPAIIKIRAHFGQTKKPRILLRFVAKILAKIDGEFTRALYIFVSLNCVLNFNTMGKNCPKVFKIVQKCQK